MVQKGTKKGKTFYSWSNFPTCTVAIWDRPINRPCPQPGSIFDRKNQETKRKQNIPSQCGMRV
ncbi:MAG TPA: hypothetical protein VLA60_03035 [Nitrospirales bacterium]|nr:hypothetical protein [Nitrospirales bacterium]